MHDRTEANGGGEIRYLIRKKLRSNVHMYVREDNGGKAMVTYLKNRIKIQSTLRTSVRMFVHSNEWKEGKAPSVDKVDLVDARTNGTFVRKMRLSEISLHFLSRSTHTTCHRVLFDFL